MPHDRHEIRNRTQAAVIGILALGLVAAAPSAHAADPLKPSRACRSAVAAGAGKLTAVALKLLDACHARRDAGKSAAPCLPLAAADPKGALTATRARIAKTIDKACAAADPVRTNFPGGQIAAALAQAVESELAGSAATLQGAPDLVGDKPAGKCHAAIGKARTAIVREIVKRATACQRGLDKTAASFGVLAGACVVDAAKAGPKAEAAIAKACRRKDGTPITGPEVSSCADLPACVIEGATATGQALAAGAYAQPSVCGDGFRDAGESCPGLEGTATEPALAAIVTTDAELGAPESEIKETPEGARVARTRIEVELAPDATVGGVNDLLTDLGARILMAVANVPILLLQIPDPGSLVALDAVLAEARAHPAAAAVTAGFFPAPDLLPDNYDVADPATDLTLVDHQLAVRAHAAWNARGALPALDGRPLVVIGDIFGDGPPDALVDAVEVVADDFATGNLYPNGHGYHVLGIVAAAGGGAACTVPLTAAQGRACATGTFPGTIRLRVADYQAGYTTTALRLKLVQRLLLAGNAVLSTSLNDCGVGTCGNPFVAAEEGSKWARMVRLAGLEDDVLHLTSAGNIRDDNPAVIDALTNSAFTAAALSGDMVDLFGDPVPVLTNVLVIENARNTDVLPYAPRCLNHGSKRGGQLGGIGTNVWSLRDATGSAFCGFAGFCTQDASGPFPTACTPGNSTPCQAGNKSGTSMATPQVAGLATYLWALDPTLSVAEIRSLLLATATPTGNDGGVGDCDPTAPKPVIDAYAAVLALDGTGTPPDPVGAPVRHAILDADGDGMFDEADLGLFLERYFDGFVDAGSHGPLVAPASRDYGRFDLNGDGFTGGPGTVPFDLDLVGSPPLAPPVLGRVFQALDEGAGAGVFFEQTGLTDLEILCYYAHSGIYQGSAAARDALLDPAWCNVIEVDARFVGYEEERLVEGEPALLRVTVVYRDATGATTPLPDVRVEVGVAGGSGDGSATTDESGVVERMVTPGGGSEDVEVTIRVRPAAGGILLAEDDLSAGVDEEDDGEEDECSDFRPDGVYLESRSSIAYGNSYGYYFAAGSTSSTTIHLYEDADRLRDRTDLPGAASDRYFGAWSGASTGGGSGSRGGVTSSGNFGAGHTSEMQGTSVVLPYPGGGSYAGFLFEGFTYEAGTQAYVEHTNSGSLRAQTSARGVGATCVEFSVVGAPAGYSFQGELGPGVYAEFSGGACAEDQADFYYYYINSVAQYPDVVEDELPRGGLLQPGFYRLCVELDAYARKSSNQPTGASPDDPDPKQHELELTFSVQ